MAEAEDVITDAALHATKFVQGVWRRHRARSAEPPGAPLSLSDVAPRLDLLIVAVLGRSIALRTAQGPARSTWLARQFQRGHFPRASGAIPATDGTHIWLPLHSGLDDATQALERFRTVALQQAMRVARGSAAGIDSGATPLVRDLYWLLEAHAADVALARLLPGLAEPLARLRGAALVARPAMGRFVASRRPLEAWARRLMAQPCAGQGARAMWMPAPPDSWAQAQAVAVELLQQGFNAAQAGPVPLLRDWWTGDWRVAVANPDGTAWADDPADDAIDASATRSARLSRTPEVREAPEDEDDPQPGAWMIQASAPHEVAEDPFGLQRPTDRDADTAADEFAESLAELDQARLVSTPGRAPEVLLSDDPPEARARRLPGSAPSAHGHIRYPEWDFRLQAYREPGAVVRLPAPQEGPQRWVDDTLAEHRSLLDAIRRRFELLRARRTPLRRQLDGEEPDLDAWVDARADFQAGHTMAQALYRSQKRTRRDMAILLLIDVSGSTDAWVSSHRRIIDVEREALLLVCLALHALGEPFAVQAFSGQGPQAVSVRTLKRFGEAYGNPVALRIAALEPDAFTRAGAAIRHASATLMREPAAQRLLLLLSDGKPNDVDCYEGRYGVEDMRRAVVEASLQGIAPFCLTVDCQAAAYLPGIFARQYALIDRPAMLPMALLDWLQRLVAAG